MSAGQGRPTPLAVTNAFGKMFSNADNVIWRDKISNFCVYFDSRDVKCEAKFSPDGKWISTERSIRLDSVPRVITDSLRSSEYSDWTETSAYILQSANETTQYHIVVTKGDVGRKILIFNQMGQLVYGH